MLVMILYFIVTPDMLSKQYVELWLEGVDTVSNVSINGQLVGRTNNMFTRYIFDVKNYLKVRL